MLLKSWAMPPASRPMASSLLSLSELLFEPLTLRLRDECRQEICHREREGLLVGHPSPGFSDVFTR